MSEQTQTTARRAAYEHTESSWFASDEAIKWAQKAGVSPETLTALEKARQGLAEAMVALFKEGPR